ncbi:hypothetical protein B6S12_01835 [Helicobacter valdiviensis]|uniref:Sulfatase N-terminal domain-containing protein n=1 Tax=Helicobacter valdiviensis TaxID=1458358 RepID=A0A2W6MWD6_9HELI|nr:phosphoethanolamine transferase [Helicobacter valdiviensis]PZT48814.1 hypothetical protein B6S12_01835 [Helicobacter valdiviensis]
MINRKIFYIALINAILFSILRNAGDGFTLSALHSGFKIFLSTFALFYCFFYILNFLPNLISQSIQRIFALIFFIIGLVELFLFANFSTLLNPVFFDTFLSTQALEAKEFLSLYLNQKTIIVTLGFTIISIMYFYIPKAIKTPIFLQKNKILFILFIICGAMILPKATKYLSEDKLMLTRWINLATHSLYKQKDYIAHFNTLKNQVDAQSKNQTLIKNESKIPNVVLIIGESTQRNYMGIYGFPLNTTPKMQELVDKGNLFVFSNIISPTAHTNTSIAKLLTFSNYENTYINWYETMNLIDIAKLAGYYTQWFSNQSAMSILGNAPEVLSTRANDVFFASLGGDENAGIFKDEVLIELFKKNHKSKDKNLYIFHLMGSHFTYKDRYNKDILAYLKPQDLINKGLNKASWGGAATLNKKALQTKTEYANTIIYNDYVIDEIIKLFKDKESLVIYLSDHADEVYDFRDFVGHADNLASSFMVEIPFMVYISDSLKEKYPSIAQKLENAKNLPQMTDDFIHSFFDLLEIATKDTKNTRSIFNTEYISNRARIYSGRDYDIELKSSYPFLAPSKTWLHRTDELKKLEDFQTTYQNFEIDVHFINQDGGYFDVGHNGLEESIGLRLETMIEALNNRRINGKFFSSKIWLDFKNLTDKNSEQALKSLEEICKNLNFNKNNFIVESNNYKELKIFKDAGFYTSYYVPYYKKEDLENNAKEIKENLQNIINTGGINALSFDSYLYDFIKNAKFTTHKNGEILDIDLLTWNEGNNYKKNMQTQLFFDPQVKVILSGVEGKYR